MSLQLKLASEWLALKDARRQWSKRERERDHRQRKTTERHHKETARRREEGGEGKLGKLSAPSLLKLVRTPDLTRVELPRRTLRARTI